MRVQLHWDQEGLGATFKKYYEDFVPTIEQYQLDLMIKPTIRDISVTTERLGYVPQYSLKILLQQLKQYGADGPPISNCRTGS